MKTRLDQLTLQQLIDLSCGDGSVLLSEGEKPDNLMMNAAAASIMAEYKAVSAPAQAKMDMAEAEQTSKLKMKERCANICLLLCSQGRCDMVREVLVELDIPERLLDTDGAVKTRSQAVLDEARFELGRIEEQERARGKKTETPDRLRKTWLAEVAYVMSVLKMPVDPPRINAAIYANLVRQSAERMKQLSKMPPMARMFM